jgi:flagellar assembly factor FliW
MRVESTRLGSVNVEHDELITFHREIIGFPNKHKYVLIPGERISWLQSTEDPALAFAVTDPTYYFKDYAVSIPKEVILELGLTVSELPKILVICNLRDDKLTGDLLGPILISTKNHQGCGTVQ